MADTYLAASAGLSVVPDMSGFFTEVERKYNAQAGGGLDVKVRPEAPSAAEGERAVGKGSRFGAGLAAGALAAGAAVGALLAGAITDALDVSAAQGKLAAQLGGNNPQWAKEMGALAGQLYTQGYGDSLESVNDALRSVIQSGAVMEDASNEQISSVTANVMNLAKAFGVDTAEAARAVGTVLRNGLAPDAETALDVITRGFQQGVDIGGDFLDTLNEYSGQFAKFGLDAQTATGLLSQGLQAGARDSDFVADALKELSIRAVDGSKTTAEGFAALGLSADDMARKFGAGGQQAAGALDLTLDRLRAMPDPVARSQAAVALFGTKAEDLGQALYALDPSSAADALGIVGGAAQNMGDALTTPQTRIDALKRTMEMGLVNFIGGTLLPIFETVAGWGARLFGPAWEPVKTFLGWLAGSGSMIAVAIGAIAVATWAWTAAQAALNATWLANPITWIVLGIIAVVAALVGTVLWAWNNVDWFRNGVLAVWSAISTAASVAWSVLKAIFGFIVSAAQAVGAAFAWLWSNVLQPVLGFIGQAVSFLGQVIAAIVFGVIILAWQALGAAWSWVWTTILQPVINFFAAAATWLWANVLQPVFGWIGAGFRALGDGLLWVWANVIKPWVIDPLAAAANWLWANVLSPVFGWIAAGWRVLSDGMRWVYDNVIRPMFDAFAAAGSWLRDRIADVAGGLERAWDALREAFAKPIRFVINTVWNDGIGGLWDKAKAILPLGEFPRVRLGFAAGGIVPGGYAPGRDSVLAMLSPGEGILRPEVVRGMGARWLDQVNRAARAGGVDGVRRFLAFGGEGPAAFADGGIVERGQAWARSQAGKPYLWGGVGPNGYDCSGFMSVITNFLQGINPLYQRRFSTASFSAGRGVAGFVPGLSSAFTVGVSPDAGGGIGHMAGTLGGLNVESRGGDGVVVGPAARGADNGLFPWKFSLPQVGGAFVSGGAGGGFVQTLRSIIEGIYDTAADALRGLVRGVFPGDGTLTGDLPSAFTDSMLSKVRDVLFGRADELDASAGSTFGGAVAEAGPVQDQVRAIAARFGWNTGAEWDAIVRIVQAESGWNPNAANPTSSARGLFQKMTSIHGPVEGSPGGQALWGLNYIKQRYGSPTAALAFRQRAGWYDAGGWLEPGMTTVYNGTGAPEAVLTNAQWDAIMGPSGLGAPRGPAVQIDHATFVDPVDVDTLLDRAEFTVKAGRL